MNQPIVGSFSTAVESTIENSMKKTFQDKEHGIYQEYSGKQQTE